MRTRSLLLLGSAVECRPGPLNNCASGGVQQHRHSTRSLLGSVVEWWLPGEPYIPM